MKKQCRRCVLVPIHCCLGSSESFLGASDLAFVMFKETTSWVSLFWNNVRIKSKRFLITQIKTTGSIEACNQVKTFFSGQYFTFHGVRVKINVHRFRKFQRAGWSWWYMSFYSSFVSKTSKYIHSSEKTKSTQFSTSVSWPLAFKMFPFFGFCGEFFYDSN